MLKGMAMEHLITQVLQREQPNTQDSIQKIKEKAKQDLSEKYKAKKNFKIKINGQESEQRFFRQYDDFLNHKMIVPINKLSDLNFDLYKQKEKDSLYTGYKKCSFCGNTLPNYICEKCDGAVTEDVENLIKYKVQARQTSENNSTAQNILDKTQGQFWCSCDSHKTKRGEGLQGSRKCYSCKKGNFQQIKLDITKKWVLVEENLSREELIETLKEQEFIGKYPLSSKVKNSRTDLWTEKGLLYLYESKNKEDTKVTVSECIQAFQYAKALKKAGLETDQTQLVYNGNLGIGVREILEDFNSQNSMQVNLLHIKDLLDRKNFFVEKVKIGKNIPGQKYGEDAEYSIDVVKSSELQDKVPIQIGGDSA